MSYEEPKKFTEVHYISSVKVTVIGEQYYPQPILDTEVKINEDQLCWIMWEQRKEFIREINMVIEKYRI